MASRHYASISGREKRAHGPGGRPVVERIGPPTRPRRLRRSPEPHLCRRGAARHDEAGIEREQLAVVALPHALHVHGGRHARQQPHVLHPRLQRRKVRHPTRRAAEHRPVCAGGDGAPAQQRRGGEERQRLAAPRRRTCGLHSHNGGEQEDVAQGHAVAVQEAGRGEAILHGGEAGPEAALRAVVRSLGCGEPAGVHACSRQPGGSAQEQLKQFVVC